MMLTPILVRVGFSPYVAWILTHEGPDKMSARSYHGPRYIRDKISGV